MVLLPVLPSLLPVVGEVLAAQGDSFKAHLLGAVDLLDARRRGCADAGGRALYSRTLFALTRCSRLLVMDDSGATTGHAGVACSRPRRKSTDGLGEYSRVEGRKGLGIFRGKIVYWQGRSAEGAGPNQAVRQTRKWQAHVLLYHC